MKSLIKNKWFKIGSIIIAVTFIVGISFVALYPEGKVSASSNYLSISLTQNNVIKQPQQELDPHYYDPVTILNSPSSNSGSWTNPTNAYADDTNLATITSGSPSTAQIYSGYGFNLTGNVIQRVRIRYDSYSVGDSSSLNQQKVPTSDESNTGAFTVTPLWSKVDETTPVDTDYITGVTNAGGRATFGFSAFTVPSDATIANVTIYYRMKSTSALAGGAACLKVGSTYWAGTQVATTTGWVTRSYAWTTNPAGGNWTVAQVNALTAFGVTSTDYNPDVQFSMIYAQVNYTTAPIDFEEVRVDFSIDGGTIWSAKQTIITTGTEATYWYDVTSLAVWTPTKLNDAHFKVRIDSNSVGTASQVRLDWIPVEVIYNACDVDYVPPVISKVSTNYFETSVASDKIKLGNTSKSTSFVPQITIGRWNESWFTMIPDSATMASIGNLGTATLNGSTITAENSTHKFVYQTTEPAVGFNELGGMDCIITYKSKPSINTLTYTYDKVNANAYLQPVLTPEEIAEGCIRPDYVVNSIAFYGNENQVNNIVGGKQYKTGKICHLYRMKAIDSLGNWVWADWSIGTGTIIQTVSQTFLDTATYPVVISPYGDTFGYTGTGGSYVGIEGNRFRCYIAIPTSAGTGVSISVWTYWAGYVTNIKGVLVEATGLTIIANGVTNANATADDNWTVCNFGTAPSITVQSYAVGLISQEPVGLKYDLPGGNQGKNDDTNSYTTPTNPTDATNSTRRYAIYCTYTPSATYDISNTGTNPYPFNFVAESSTYYAHAGAPSDPVDPTECTWTLTNNGSVCDLDMKMADFTGGVGWNIEETAGAPGQDEVKITAYYNGQSPAGYLLLKNADQEFYDGLAGAGHIHWDITLLTGSPFTDGQPKSGILTITARAET